MYSLSGRNIVSISAGKYWTASVTATGDVYFWDGKNNKDGAPIATRLHGIKRATSVCVGETHILIVSALYHPMYPPTLAMNKKKPISDDNSETEELDNELMFKDIEDDKRSMGSQIEDPTCRAIPTLKSLCEKVAAELLVEPRNAVQFLEIAESLGADELRKHCEVISLLYLLISLLYLLVLKLFCSVQNIVLRNLDYIFTVSAPAITSASPEILAKLEKLLDERSSEPWSCRRLPTFTATFPAVIYNEDEGDKETCSLLPRDHKKPTLRCFGDGRADLFLQGESDADQAVSKQVRALRKKLQQIEVLEDKQLSGCVLDDQQIAKLQTKFSLETALADLGFPLERDAALSSPGLSDSKGNKMVEVSKKQRRKNKQKFSPQSEIISKACELFTELDSVKEFPVDKNVRLSDEKVSSQDFLFVPLIVNFSVYKWLPKFGLSSYSHILDNPFIWVIYIFTERRQH